ncbi:MAG: ImmA/IrrE family metallo-endopeptidase [Vicinamibacteria bacterium]
MEQSFNPSRLVVARARRALFQVELAERCDVSAHTVAAWESGAQAPNEMNITRIAAATGFPKAFFHRSELEPLTDGAASFRARTKIPARQKQAALSSGAMAREFVEWLENRFELPSVDLPDLGAPELRSKPRLVAKLVRDEWMLGDKPIPNVIRLLESRGVLVFSLVRDVQELDAFSFWSKGRPIVFLNTMKSVERGRFDAAHELMHLLCHREKTDKKEEAEANEFAGSFLMPKADIYANVPRIPDLNTYLSMKHRWRVSLSSLVYRLHELRLLSTWQYRVLMVELSKRGYLKSEPNPLVERESSTVLAQVFASLAKRGVRVPDIAREIAWQREDLEELIFGLGATMLQVAGGKGQTKVSGRTSPRRNHLRLVR